MELDLSVSGVAKKIVDGKDEFYFITNKEGQPDKWFRCSEKVKGYLGAIKPCIITIDERIDNIITKVNYVKQIHTPGDNKSVPTSKKATGDQQSLNPDKATLGFLSTPGELDELDDLLSLAEDRLIQATNMWEQKKQNKDTKGALESLAKHKANLYKFMDRIKS